MLRLVVWSQISLSISNHFFRPFSFRWVISRLANNNNNIFTSFSFLKLNSGYIFADQRQAEESSTVIEMLETIDDDLSTRGVHMVKVSDIETIEEYGIEDPPEIVYFENGIPSLYPGMARFVYISKNS